MKPTSLQNVFYRASNMKEADRFYSGVVDATLKFADGEKWRQYDIDGRKFALSSDAEAHPEMRGAAVVFEVHDLENSKTKAIELGGKILEVRDMGSHGTTVVLADPDGNVLHLWQRPSTP